MQNIRALLEKYQWMAADAASSPVVEREPAAYSILTSEEQHAIREEYRKRAPISYRQLARDMNLPYVTVRRVILGTYRGVRRDIRPKQTS